MAKFEGHNRLHPDDRELIIQDFYNAFLEVKSEDELVSFLNDLLSEPELEMLARRVQIARMLKEGFTYEEIRSALYVSEGTVASTAQSLKRGEGGLETVVSRMSGISAKNEVDEEVAEEIEVVEVNPAKTEPRTRTTPMIGRLREERSEKRKVVKPAGKRLADLRRTGGSLGWSR